jgi:hypothetical protein
MIQIDRLLSLILTHFWLQKKKEKKEEKLGSVPPITYYWKGLLILDHSYLVGKLTSSKFADTEVSGFSRFYSFCFSNFWICQVLNKIWVVQYWGHCPIIGDCAVWWRDLLFSWQHNFTSGPSILIS